MNAGLGKKSLSLVLSLLLLGLSNGVFAATSVVKTTYIGACTGGGGPQDLKRLTCSVSGNSLSCTYRRFGFNNLTGFESACGNGTGQTIINSATAANTLLDVQFLDSAVLFPTDRVCVTDALNTPLCWNVNLAGSNPSMTMNMTVNDDIDSDGWQNATDNCLAVPNPNQFNTDSDSQGNDCDTDDDNDGVADASDAFQLNAAGSTDTDQDGKPDSWNVACDVNCQSNSGLTLDDDDDNDAVLDVDDNCPLKANSNQADLDSDGAGNACDADDDNDGQLDTADADDDNDGVLDTSDTYPLDPLYSADTDRDTLPDNWETANGRDPAKADYAVPVSSGSHTCAIDEEGVKCWGGSNANGQLNVPATLSHPYSVTTGNNWSCACDDNGSQCWGDGYPATPSCSASVSASHRLSSQVQGSCFGGVGNVPRGYDATTQCSITAKGDVLCDTSGSYEIAPRVAPFIAYTCYWTTGSITGEDKVLSPGNNARQLGQSSAEPCVLNDRGVECFSVDSVVGNASIVAWQTSSFVLSNLRIDSDGDGVPRPIDANDLDAAVPDGADTDADGIDDNSDNCVSVFNTDQVNTDGDSEGNACDSDDDNDGVADASDAFPLDATESVDADGDGIGNNADSTPNGDTDSDGVDNLADNCASISNADQLNTDGDSEGNACDSDDDNDGVADTSDAFPLDASESVDTDGDGIGNNADNCVAVTNAAQTDTDADGFGDACDNTPNGDTDNDGLDNAADNCPLVANANQLDYDADGAGDACDDPVPLPDDIVGTIKNTKAGSAVAFAGDFNGDGYGDYVIGSPGYSVRAAPPVKAIIGAGKAEVISGKDGSVIASIIGNAAKDAMGFAVAGNADIDKDGFADVVVGAPNATALRVGSVTVLYGGTGNRRHTFWGATKNTGFGSAVALGDVNGDEYADVLIGAPKDKSPASSQKAAGSVTVFDGNTLQSRKRFYGLSTNAHAGTAVAAGDVDNDGVADIIVGAPDENGVGSVRAYNSGGTELLQKLGTNKKARFGKAVASADINHDDYADIVVGAPLDDDADSRTKDTGSISVISGSDGELLSTKQFGAVKKAWLGSSVALGDVNGDGTLDIIASAPQDDNVPTATHGTGSVTVWNGATYTPIKTVYGDAFGDLFGAAVSAGDINSDGKADLIIGIPNKDVELESSVQKDAGGVKVIGALQL